LIIFIKKILINDKIIHLRSRKAAKRLIRFADDGLSPDIETGSNENADTGKIRLKVCINVQYFGLVSHRFQDPVALKNGVNKRGNRTAACEND
jgi:hypothetical protein